MKKYIAMIVAFIAPILGKAFLQSAADELARVAYPPTERRRYPAYNRRPSSYSGHNRVGENPFTSFTQKGTGRKATVPTHELDAFHDVLMVAFDIRGTDRETVEAFIQNYMPITGRQMFNGKNVNLDSFWIADDDSFDSDCDSAVFVSKGNQAKARELLREHGLVG